MTGFCSSGLSSTLAFCPSTLSLFFPCFVFLRTYRSDARTGSQNDSPCHGNCGNGENAQGSGKRQLFNRYYPSSAMMRGVIPELPQALAQLLPPAVKLPPVNLSYPRPSFSVYSQNDLSKSRRLVQNWLQNVYNAPKGTINTTLSIMAGRAFRLLSHGLSEGEIWNAFEYAGVSRGLSRDEVKATLQSARNYGIQRQFPID